MKMFLSLMTLIMSFSAHATLIGGNSGGGGKGVVCRSPKGAVKSVELLDLWEARELFKRKIVKSNAPLAVQVQKAIDALQNVTDGEYGLWNPARHVYEPVPQHTREAMTETAQLFLKPNKSVLRLHHVTLTPTDDSFEAAHPADCAVEQLVSFDDTSEGAFVSVNQDLVERMDVTDQAALITHEALYQYMRKGDNEPNSVRVRRAVGYVMAGNELPALRSIIGTRYIVCEAAEDPNWNLNGNTTIYFFLDKDGTAVPLDISRFGEWMIGFFPITGQHTGFGSFDDILALQGQACDAKDSLSVGISRNPVGGPIDFETSDWLIQGCDHGSLGLWLSTQMAGPMLPLDAKRLTCKLVDKTKQN